MPKYKLKLPQWANTDAQTTNGTQPNQKILKNIHENEEPQPIFEKSPIFITLS